LWDRQGKIFNPGRSWLLWGLWQRDSLFVLQWPCLVPLGIVVCTLWQRTFTHQGTGYEHIWLLEKQTPKENRYQKHPIIDFKSMLTHLPNFIREVYLFLDVMDTSPDSAADIGSMYEVGIEGASTHSCRRTALTRWAITTSRGKWLLKSQTTWATSTWGVTPQVPGQWRHWYLSPQWGRAEVLDDFRSWPKSEVRWRREASYEAGWSPSTRNVYMGQPPWLACGSA